MVCQSLCILYRNNVTITYLGFEPMWVDDIDVADDLIRDFECGLERATVLSTFGSENLPTSASNSLVQVCLCLETVFLPILMHMFSGLILICYRGLKVPGKLQTLDTQLSQCCLFKI